jgi:hypothetical protein
MARGAGRCGRPRCRGAGAPVSAWPRNTGARATGSRHRASRDPGPFAGARRGPCRPCRGCKRGSCPSKVAGREPGGCGGPGFLDDSPAPDGRKPSPGPRWPDTATARHRTDGAQHGIGHGVRLPAQRGAQAVVDRLPGGRRHAGHELLRPAGIRGAAGLLPSHRQRRHSVPRVVPARPCRHPHRGRRRARVLVGLHVRVPDAFPGHARTERQPAGGYQQARRAAADRLRDGAARPMGRVGIRL